MSNLEETSNHDFGIVAFVNRQLEQELQHKDQSRYLNVW